MYGIDFSLYLNHAMKPHTFPHEIAFLINRLWLISHSPATVLLRRGRGMDLAEKSLLSWCIISELLSVGAPHFTFIRPGFRP